MTLSHDVLVQEEEKRQLAADSKAWNLHTSNYKDMFPQLSTAAHTCSLSGAAPSALPNIGSTPELGPADALANKMQPMTLG